MAAPRFNMKQLSKIEKLRAIQYFCDGLIAGKNYEAFANAFVFLVRELLQELSKEHEAKIGNSIGYDAMLQQNKNIAFFSGTNVIMICDPENFNDGRGNFSYNLIPDLDYLRMTYKKTLKSKKVIMPAVSPPLVKIHSISRDGKPDIRVFPYCCQACLNELEMVVRNWR